MRIGRVSCGLVFALLACVGQAGGDEGSGPRDTPPPQATASPGLTLADLEAIASESNPTLQQAAMAIQAARGRCLQAGLYPNPEFNYIGDEIGNDGTQGLQGAGFTQEIVTANKRQLSAATASYEVEEARCGWESQRMRILNDVRVGYYLVLLAQKTLAISEQLVRIGDEGLQTTEKLRTAKAVSLTDVLQARIEAQTARLSLNQAENRHRAAWRQLATVLGRPNLEPSPLAGDVDADLPDLNWDNVLQRVLTHSPELAGALAGVERARSNVALQCASRRPNISIAAAAKYDTGSYDSVADLGLVVPLPLFDRNQGNILAAQAELIAAENEVQRVGLDLQNRLAVAFEQYANARRQVETYLARILPDAKQSLDLVNAGYRAGEFDYLQVLTAQRTYFSVTLDYLQSLEQLRASAVELEGMLLRDSLTAGP
ncbi:MAG: TolC family protein [Candidatus Anammoximicrobium sp.]|nr:TolC family protein [Candidatus Anammoximicrobium sp.]